MQPLFLVLFVKKLLFTNLPDEIDEARVRHELKNLGRIDQVRIFRDEGLYAPIAIVEVDLTDTQALAFTARVRRYWFGERLVSAFQLLR